MLREKGLNADTRVHLEMVGIPYRLGHVGTHGRPYKNSVKRKTRFWLHQFHPATAVRRASHLSVRKYH